MNPGRASRWLKREMKRPGTLAQFLAFGGIVVIWGLMGVFGLFGGDVESRLLGGVVVLLGLVLMVLTVRRLRR